MNKIQIILDNFSEFELEANPIIFNEIFGDSVSDHLWQKFIFNCSGSILKLWRILDKESQVKLAVWIQNNLEDLKFLK